MGKATFRRIYPSCGNILFAEYECQSCRQTLQIPQQQNLRYCFHCGEKIQNWDKVWEKGSEAAVALFGQIPKTVME